MHGPARRTTTTALAVIALVLGVGLTGCGDDDPGADPTDAPSTSAADASTSASASPSVEAATGPLLTMPNATMNAPEGWKKLPDFADFSTEANPPGALGAARLSALELPAAGSELSTALQAQAALESDSDERKPRRLPDVEIGGEAFYHLAGPANDTLYTDSYGSMARGYQTTIDFEFERSVSPAERERLVAASLATFTWR